MFLRPHTTSQDANSCRYPGADLQFRGPARNIKAPHILFLGGNAVFGKYVPQSLTDRVEAHLGIQCVNAAQLNAGVDVLARAMAITGAGQRPAATVVEVVGAANQTNRFYRVHPRRNDRFIRPLPLMSGLFPEADFAEVTFTRHALQLVSKISEARFDAMVEELKAQWVERMRAILLRLPAPRVLLWVAPHKPRPMGWNLKEDPILLDRGMIGSVRDLVEAVVVTQTSPEAWAQGTKGMVFSHGQAAAAASLPGPAVLDEVAAQLIPVLDGLISGEADRILA